MNIVILAAGKGKRMRSLHPKVLQPLAGRPMLDHVLATVQGFSEKPSIVVVGHGADEVEARYADRSDIRFVLQAEQHGTGHALQVALDELDAEDPQTLVCLGDVPLLSCKTIAAMREECGLNDMVLLTIKLDQPQGYGRIVRDEFGRVAKIVEEKDATADEKLIREVNTGIMILPTARLRGWLGDLTNDNAQHEYYLTDVVRLAARDGARIATVHPEHAYEVQGVNSKAQLANLERVWQRAQADGLLEAGVTLIDPERIDIRGELICGRDVEIDCNVIFEGRVELGDEVCVGANCVLRNVKVASGVEILPFCHLDGAEIGAGCRIGPYSRIRPGTTLMGNNHIGNFVEVKKSDVGAATKINHLTYIGDAEIGERVNIGAGTITCNYDGVHKYKTLIGDDAFIGSGSELVAPVEIGRGATIGAGTTLTRMAPKDKLTVARARQVTIDAWRRPQKDEQ